MAKSKLETGLGGLFRERIEQGKVQASQDTKPRSEAKDASELVRRDTFSIPLDEYEKLDELVIKLGRLGIPRAARSEIVRAGILALLSMSDKQLVEAFSKLKRIKTGRRKAS